MSVGRPSPVPRSIDEVLAEARAGLVRVGARQAAEMQAAGALLVDIRPGRVPGGPG